MGLLVCLILEDDDAKANVSCGDDQRITSYEGIVSPATDDTRKAYERLRTDANKRKLPCEDETKDGTGDDGGDGLNDAGILVSTFHSTCQDAISETHTARVAPARRKIFWGLPARPVVNVPVLFSVLSKNSMSWERMVLKDLVRRTADN